MKPSHLRRGFFYLLAFAAILFIIQGVRGSAQATEVLSISEVASAASEGRIAKITVSGDELAITFTNNEEATAFKESGSSTPEQLAALGVSTEQLSEIEWRVMEPRDLDIWLSMLTYILPLVFVAGLVYMFMRQAQRPEE